MSIKKIFVLLIVTIFLCVPYVFAAERQILIEGDEEAKIGETKTLTVQISSEIEIGIISGTIEKNENISNITVQGKNNWNLTYNEETGIFNIYKAEGAKSEEIMSIEYTVSNTEGTGKITISNIELTTIDYESTNIDDLTKEITITKEEQDVPVEVKLSSIKIVQAPIKITYTEGESFDTTGMLVEAQYSDGTSKNVTNYTYTPDGSLDVTDDKITVSYTEGEITKTAEQEIVVTPKTEDNQQEDDKQEDNQQEDDKQEDNQQEDDKQEDNQQEDDKQDTPKEDSDNTIAENKIPNAGVSQYLVTAIITCLIVSIICYKAHRHNKDI